MIDFVKKFLDKEFFLEHVDAKPFFLSGIILSFAKTLDFLPYTLIQVYFKQGEADWITLLSDQERILNKILDLQINKPRYWFDKLESWLKDKQAIVDTWRELQKKDLTKLSEEELLFDLKRIFDNQLRTRHTSSLIDGFYILGAERLMKLLQKTRVPEEELQDVFNKLIIHEEESYLKIFNNNLGKINDFILNNNLDLDNPGEELKVLLQKHLEDYSWIKTHSFRGAVNYAYEELVDEIKNFKPSYSKPEMPDKEKLLVKYGLGQEIKAISELANLFAKWQDLRKENSLISTYLSTLYLEEFSRRRKVDFDLLTYLYFPELKKFLSGEISIEDLEKRKQGSYFIFKGKEFEVYLYEDVKEVVDKILFSYVDTYEELKGYCASKGQAKGEVKTIMNINDVVKVNEGDVLVAATTRPEFLSAMKKASAIVTVEGGITSHAVITSRELGIPCIIGVKNALKVLKDGDIIEVNADKGKVKKL